MSPSLFRPAGAVLAGGSSRRYGRDKAAAALRGRPMAGRAAAALRPLVRPPVLLVGGDEALARRLDAVPIADRRPGRGPLAGLEVALEFAADAGAPGAFVLACDLPLVPSRLVERILLAAGDGERAVVPEAPGPLGVQPLCAYYPTPVLPLVDEVLGGGSPSMRAFVEELGPRRLPLERVSDLGEPGEIFLNVNTPADRKRARALLGRESAGRRGPRRRGRRMSGEPGASPERKDREPAPPIVSVVGWKDSGKTGLVVRLVKELTARGRSVMTLKHGHGFEVDTPGTDSWRHRHEGSARRVVLAGPDRVAVMGEWGPDGEPGPRALAARFLRDAELVVAEGWKRARLPKIEVHRRAVGRDPIYDPGDPGAGSWLALVTDRTDLELAIPVLDPDAPDLVGRLADRVENEVLPDGAPGR